MFLDMTFRFELSDRQFESVQLTLAECANQVQRDKNLWTTIEIPHNEGAGRVNTQGFLIEAKRSF